MNTIKNIRLSIQKQLVDANLIELKHLLSNFSAYSSILILSENKILPLIGKKKNSEFIYGIYSYIKEKIETEKQSGKVEICLRSKLPISMIVGNAECLFKLKTAFVKAPDKYIFHTKFSNEQKMTEFEHHLFKLTLDIITENQPKDFEKLKKLWGGKVPINYIAKKSVQLNSVELIDFTFQQISLNDYKANSINYFFKNIISDFNTSTQIDYIEKIWAKYEDKIKNTFILLNSQDKFWINNENLHEKNLDQNKLMWLEQHKIGLKSSGYKQFEFFLPFMKKDLFNFYIDNDKEVLLPLVEDLLIKNKQSNIGRHSYWTNSWHQKKFSDEFKDGISMHEKISLYMQMYHKENFHNYLSKELLAPLEKTKSIKI